jgi:carbamoyl-phosphate synthase large subunit
MRILLTGIGCPGTPGTLHALKMDNEKHYIVGVDMNEDILSSFSFFCNATYPVPAPNTKGYIKNLIEICKKEKVKLLIPQTTNETEAINNCLSAFSIEGIYVLTPVGNTYKYNNKYLLLGAAKYSGLTVSPFAYSISGNKIDFFFKLKELGYPKKDLIIKPCIGNGGRGVKHITLKSRTKEEFISKYEFEKITPDELTNLFGVNNFPDWLIMSYLPGMEYSVDVLNTPDTEPFIVIRRRDVIRSGITFSCVVVSNDEIEQQIKTLLKNYPLYGLFGFQFKENEEGYPEIIECNPRVQGTLVASCLSSPNLLTAAIEYTLEGKIKNQPVLPKANTKVTRYWGAISGDVKV